MEKEGLKSSNSGANTVPELHSSSFSNESSKIPRLIPRTTGITLAYGIRAARPRNRPRKRPCHLPPTTVETWPQLHAVAFLSLFLLFLFSPSHRPLDHSPKVLVALSLPSQVFSIHYLNPLFDLLRASPLPDPPRYSLSSDPPCSSHDRLHSFRPYRQL